MLYFFINNGDVRSYIFWITVTNKIVTFIVTLYMYNTYVWNRHKRVLKEMSVMFDHVAINHNYYRFRVEPVN